MAAAPQAAQQQQRIKRAKRIQKTALHPSPLLPLLLLLPLATVVVMTAATVGAIVCKPRTGAAGANAGGVVGGRAKVVESLVAASTVASSAAPVAEVNPIELVFIAVVGMGPGVAIPATTHS